MKAYIKPEVLLTSIKLQNMIALSMSDGEANPNGEVLSRKDNSSNLRYSVWDEDEEEEEF